MRKSLWTALACVAALSACKAETEDLEKVINGYNFVRLNPPTTLYQPGSLVHRVKYDPDDRDPEAASLGFLCSPRFSTEKYEHDPLTSDSESSEISRKLSGSFSVSPKVLVDVFGLTATAKAARTATVSLQDVTISAYGRDDLLRIRRGLGDICSELLRENIATNNAYQIEKTLTASVQYKIEFDTGASVELKAKALKELGEIGTAVSSENTTEVTGKALIYGIHWQDLGGGA